MTLTSMKPYSWQEASETVVNVLMTSALHPVYSHLKSPDACQKEILEEFEKVVEKVFQSGDFSEEADKDFLHKTFFNIGSAALRGLSYESKSSIPECGRHVLQTVIGKQRMYGHGNIARFGIPGIVIRMNDKMERLKNLQSHTGPVLFEPIKDTWLDICGYAIIAMMWSHGWFMLDLDEYR